LLGGGSLQPSPLMRGGGALPPSPLLGGGGLSLPARSVRLSDSSMPPSPVMPDSPSQAGRLSDASGGDASSYLGGSSSGMRLSSLVAAESRLRRKPQSTGGSAQSSPRAPVGIAETEFRRRGSVPTDGDEIEAEVLRLDSSGGLRTLGSARDRSLNYRDSTAMSAPGATATGNPFASSSSATVGTAGTLAAAGAGLGSSAAKAERSAGAAVSKAGTGVSGGGAAAAGGAAGAAGAAAVSGKPGFLGSLFGKFPMGVLCMGGCCYTFVYSPR
jgi:hypothetical protein